MTKEQRFFIDSIWAMIQMLDEQSPNTWGFKIKTKTDELVDIPFSDLITITCLKKGENKNA